MHIVKYISFCMYELCMYMYMYVVCIHMYTLTYADLLVNVTNIPTKIGRHEP